ncbi:MAG TPA: hypothetical protein VJS69_12215 [Candidatus Krumholzibacteria bacterium]|nr:hypothetical protein [Candidatus Krumholzibacteria bacterium]
MTLRTRPLVLAAACAALAAISGCYVQSIRPAYTEKTRAYDGALVGTWTSDEDEEYVFTISDTTRGEYTLVSDQGGSEARFEAVLFQVGGAAFLDIYPEAPETENTFYMDHLLRVHNILRVEMEADTLWVQDFDAEWLQDAINKKQVRLANVPLDGAILLTGSTNELQSFITKYAKAKQAYSEPAKFIRSN